MKSKEEFIELINSGATEQRIATFLKNDLTLLPEVYAYPQNEYICIPQFPIDDGKVDYIIMTGRSRMKITLIEIKGADFTFINKGTNKLNEKINEGIQQIDNRFSFIDKNYEFFRKKVHDYRQKAEGNYLNFQYSRGNDRGLYVDQDKEVVISRCVVIGGKSTNDIEESKIRDSYERKGAYRMKLESWDSFIRQLSRD